MPEYICTIIAKNYIAFARTLCWSFLEYHPDGKCLVLIIDDFEGCIDAKQESFQVIKINDLNIPKLDEFCYKYNITELSTAVKPYLLEYLFDSMGMDRILYLDPDILITNSLDGLYDELRNNDIALTPHLDKDYPDDGLMPNDGHIMRSGIFNLGFIGVRKCENVKNFLVWWQRKLYDKCVIDPPAGYFVDQKFIDYAFVLFPNILIIKNPGYNVAYWNIHGRKIHKRSDVWRCNDGLLYFYHFSNYKPDKPMEISGHQNRFYLEDLSGLHELFMRYNEKLRKNGYDGTKELTYSYNNYTNGRIISDFERIDYRNKLPFGVVSKPFVWEDHSIEFRERILLRESQTYIERKALKIKFAIMRFWRKLREESP